MARRKGFLFDMDGVVCHNMPAHEEAWRLFLRGHGVELELAEFRAKTMGMPTHEVLAYYGVKGTADEKEELYRSLYKPRAMPGLRAFLRAAKDQALGLGTGSKGDNVSFILDGLRLRASFHAVVDGSMVKKGKPHPETFLLLADALNVRPKDCVVFEDSLLGEEAARRAGMAVVGITTSHRADEFRHARLRRRDFTGLKVSAVLDLLD
ncbi:MAG: HAD-IA family hydrolase [Elusimicrobiota bacterium]|nr:HAD-IA family hydrolase [Elusimicrobiota bacterium]